MNDRENPKEERNVTSKTVFIDRDGVINRDSPDYIKTQAEFHFLPGSLEAFRLLSEHHYTAIVITNQSVIGRKLTSPDELRLIFDTMKKDIVKAGGSVSDIMFCPHTPSDNCRCRKPEPGMILDARDKHHINLATSVMIGDSVKDILCGKNAGVGQTVLVKTGNGVKAQAELIKRGIVPDHVAEDLLDAVRWIIENDGIHDGKH